MKLQQLKYIWEVAHHDLNVSATAQSYLRHNPESVSNSAVRGGAWGGDLLSKWKHLTHITPAGEAIIEMAGEILRQTESIKRIAQDHSDNVSGSMSLATTHGQARYVLPDSILGSRLSTPRYRLRCARQPPANAEMAAKGAWTSPLRRRRYNNTHH